MHAQPAPERRSAVDVAVRQIRALIDTRGMRVDDVLPSEKDHLQHYVTVTASVLPTS